MNISFWMLPFSPLISTHSRFSVFTVVMFCEVSANTDLANIEPSFPLGEICMCVYTYIYIPIYFCIYLSYMDYNLKLTCHGRVYFLYFTKRKWGSQVLGDLPKATSLTDAWVGVQTPSNWPKSQSFLHYAALPPPVFILWPYWKKKAKCHLVRPQLGMCTYRAAWSFYSSAHVTSWLWKCSNNWYGEQIK